MPGYDRRCPVAPLRLLVLRMWACNIVVLALQTCSVQALKQSLGEFLGRACPSSGQLASFLSTREDLDIHTVMSVIKFIPKDKTEVGVVQGEQKVEVVEVREINTEVGMGEEKQVEMVKLRKMLNDFLQFAQFPELTREELVEGFLKMSVNT